ncbi:hypothetical protein EV368DRAFT_86443 [Lentinula lateritia]|uniref:Uncharacterized protein n=1 Tax=Lentinula aff. lateritia TaxID=2804960 RepID=A0ACC1U0U1_9AGAR|nr:hypothetical protein F5876DRAFT_76792 [Lentinula aff. lateritia]KAJ3848601.1 hypothetical protein EV368DRAFT_86443 [Lentinula lateritia]
MQTTIHCVFLLAFTLMISVSAIPASGGDVHNAFVADDSPESDGFAEDGVGWFVAIPALMELEPEDWQ